MVKALEDAIKTVEALSAAEQESIAAIIRAEIEDDAAWQKRFSETSDVIAKIVEGAKHQYRAGEYGEFEPQ